MIEISHRDGNRGLAGAMNSWTPERAISPAKQDAELVRLGAAEIAVSDSQIEDAIVIQVTRGHPGGAGAGDIAHEGLKGSVAVARQNLHRIGEAGGHGQ